ncbi:MAG: tetratricopeptide repeat protein, partial [Anaerolineales bacterium]|jgi:tetratricopeptide (TPR) repeat protein
MAVRAGLSILEISKRLASELEAQRGIHNFQVRVGINTGLAAIGGMTEAEDTLMGSPVNLAKRVESAASPGSLFISHNTYQHVRGVFNVEIQDPIQAKGFTEPVRVYRVLAAKQHAFRMRTRGVEGIETRMVGRQAELLTLQNAYQDALRGEKTQIVTVIGEAGVGKSRLLYEFQNWLELTPEDIFFLQGYARQETQHLPYALLRDVFAFRFQIQESDDAREVWKKVERGFSEVLGDNEDFEMRAHIMGQLLGFDFSESQHLKGVLENPKQLRERSFTYLKEYIETVSQRHPMVVLLEDIHWGDNSSLEMLNRFIHKLPKQRLLIVFLARHRLFDRYPEWGQGLDHHTRLSLEPLSQQNCNDLVDEILKLTHEVPASLRDTVVSNAEGNPYYVEELIKMLIEDGVILTGEERWWIQPERLTEVKIPPTLTNVLQARLDSLPPQEGKTLQQASVVGRTFWDRIVAYIEGKSGEPVDQQQVTNTLFDLQGREMIYRQPNSAFAGAGEYNFKHAILREVTYESVLLRQRHEYHSLVADWLIEHAYDRVAEYAGLIADHLEVAGRTERAIQYLLKAGERASQSYANIEAVDYFSRAIKLAEKEPPDINCLAKLHRGRGLTSESMGDFEQARNDHETILKLAHRADERQIEWQALIDLGRLWASRDYNQTQNYFQKALKLSRKLTDPAATAVSLNWMGNWYLNTDNPDKAIAYHLEALEITEQLGNPRDLANTLDLLGIAYMFRGDSSSSVECYNQAIALYRELDDRPSLVSSLIGHGHNGCAMLTYLTLVQAITLKEAGNDFEEALGIAREIGSLPDEIWALWSLGLLYLAQGQFGQALEATQRGLRIATDIEHREFIVWNRSVLGELHLALLRPEEARQQFEKGLSFSKELKSNQASYITTGGLSKALLLLGELNAAQTYLDSVLSSQTPMNNMNIRYCWAIQAELALEQGDPVTALDIADRLIESAHGMSSGVVITFLWKLRGEAFAALGQIDEAESLLRAAMENAQANGERYLLWSIHASLGKLYETAGKQTEAVHELSTAKELIQELADTVPNGLLRDNFLRRANERLRSSP